MTVPLAVLDIGDVKFVIVFMNGPATAADYAALEASAANAGFGKASSSPICGPMSMAVPASSPVRTAFHALFQAVDHDQLRAQATATLRLS